MAIKGFIEAQSSNHLRGWCVDTDKPETPLPIRVCWNGHLLRTTTASRPRPDVARVHGVERSGFFVPIHPQLLSLLPWGTLLDVMAPDGTLLKRFGVKHEPIGLASDAGSALSAKLSSGYRADKWGALKLPFSAMSDEERYQHAAGMKEVADYFEARFGIPAFIHYGTLLGYVREGGFLPHDDDADLSYVIQSNSFNHIVDHFFEIVDAMISDGHDIWIENVGQISVRLKGSNNQAVDIFTSWHQPNGAFYTYFGVSGHLRHPLTFSQEEMEGVIVNVPSQADRLLEMAYGPHWRVPDPHFYWTTGDDLTAVIDKLRAMGADRVAHVRERVSGALQEEESSERNHESV